MSPGDFKKWQCPPLLFFKCSCQFLDSLMWINCTPGSRSASLQNGPCTPTTQEDLKKKIIMHKN